MAYRTRKQITIAVIFFLILAALGTAVYFVFLKPAPSCFDGIKNQDEDEVDCGGNCETDFDLPCEKKFLKNVEVVWAEVIPVTQNVYDLAASIRNPNPNYGTSNLRYSFVFKGAGGQVLEEHKDGITFILPNATKYVIENNIETKEPVASVELKIEMGDRENWEKIKDYQAISLVVKDRQFDVASGTASGTIKNDTDFSFDKVDVNVVLFDSARNPIGALKSVMRTLTAGEARGFSLRWFYSLNSDILYPDMQAETNLFSDENYMEIHGEPGSGY
ncbi:MAG: hypothetical protein V1845_01475 [bacterium]